MDRQGTGKAHIEEANMVSSTQDSVRPPLSDMYARWTLDCVVEVAYAIALDFANRPRHYRKMDVII